MQLVQFNFKSTANRRSALRTLCALVLLCAAVFGLGVSSAHAQAVNGTILGTVTDPAGSAVPNAQVTIVLSGQSTVHN